MSGMYFLLGCCLTTLVLVTIYLLRPKWTNEKVADFTWAVLYSTLKQNYELMLEIFDAHFKNDEEKIKSLQTLVYSAVSQLEQEEENYDEK